MVDFIQLGQWSVASFYQPLCLCLRLFIMIHEFYDLSLFLHFNFEVSVPSRRFMDDMDLGGMEQVPALSGKVLR